MRALICIAVLFLAGCERNLPDPPKVIKFQVTTSSGTSIVKGTRAYSDTNDGRTCIDILDVNTVVASFCGENISALPLQE